MRRLSRGLHIVALLLALVMIIPAHVRAADTNATRIAEALKGFTQVLDGAGSLSELQDILPLTSIGLGDDDALRLNSLFQDSLRSSLDTLAVYTSLDDVRDLIDAADGQYGGVEISFDAVTLAPDLEDSALINLDFAITVRRTISAPLAFAGDVVDIQGGGVELTLSLSAALSFQLDTNVLAAGLPHSAFYLRAHEGQTILLSADAAPADGAGGSIGTLNAQLGFTTLTVTGTLGLDLDFTLDLLDPDHDGKITEYEWATTALDDLFDFRLAEDPTTSAVDAALYLDSSLLPGSPDGTIALLDADLSDGLVAPTVTLNALEHFRNLSALEVLNGLTQLATGLLSAQGASDPKLPFMRERPGNAFAFAEPLVNFLKKQGDAGILCGTNDTLPPSGDIKQALPGDLIYCQAYALQNPTAVTWSIREGGGSLLANTSGADALATVGVKPTANAEFRLRGVNQLPIWVDFTYADGSVHTVYPRFLSAQDLFALLAELGGFDDSAENFYYDPATRSLNYHLVKSFDPAPLTASVDFADQLRKVNLGNLSVTGGASATIDPQNVAVDITLGLLLVEPEAMPPDATLADRFFLSVGDDPAKFEFQADLPISATLDLQGSIGFLEVQAEGDGAANLAAPGTVFAVGRSDPAQPMLGINIDAPGFTIGQGVGLITIPNAVQASQLLSHTLSYVQPSCNIAMTSGISVSATLGRTFGGRIGISWPDAFRDGCVLDRSTLLITPDGDYLENLFNFDINPHVSGVHVAPPSAGLQGVAVAASTDPSLLVDPDKTFTTVPGLLGSTIKNQTDGSTCTVAQIIDDTTLFCTLSGGDDNTWQDGDEYDGGGNMLALLSLILDNVDALASTIDSLAGTGLQHGLDKKLPLVDVTPRELLSQFDRIKAAINDIRTGSKATIVCGTQDGAPPSGSATLVLDNQLVYCRATLPRNALNAAWSITGGTALSNTLITDPQTVLTVGTGPTLSAVFRVENADAATGMALLGEDYSILLEYTDASGLHSAEYPVIPASSLQKLEKLLERKLGLPPEAIGLDLRDVPPAGSPGETGDGIQDLVITLGYGICTEDGAIIDACQPVDRKVAKPLVPVNINLGQQGLAQVQSASSLELEYAARAQLDLAIPLRSVLDPGTPAVLGSSNITLQAGVNSENINLKASFLSLQVNVGNGAPIADGTHSAAISSTHILSDTAADFQALGVPVAGLLKNTTDDTECSVTQVQQHSLVCAPQSAMSWDQGDAYVIESVGMLKLGAEFTLRHQDGLNQNRAYALGDFPGGLQAKFQGLGQANPGANPITCGVTYPEDVPGPQPLDGDACAKLSITLDVEDAGIRTYLGEIDFRIEQLTDGPDALNTYDGYYASVPDDLLQKVKDSLLDWKLLLEALEQLTADLASKLDGASQNVKAPLIGSALDAGAKIADKLHDLVVALQGLASKIDTKIDLDSPESPVTVDDIKSLIQQEVLDKLGPSSSVKLLLEWGGDPDTIDVDDVGVEMRCSDPDGGDDYVCAGDESPLKIVDVRLTVNIGQQVSTELPFDIGLNGLPLSAMGNVEATAGWSLLLDFGLSKQDGPYLIAGGNGHGDDPELQLEAAIQLAEPASPAECNENFASNLPSLANFNRNRCMLGELGFLRVLIQDGADENGSTETTDDDRTRVSLTTSLDLQSQGDDERLSFGEIVGGDARLALGLEAAANIDVRVKTGFGGGSDLPSLVGSLHFGWSISSGSGNGSGMMAPGCGCLLAPAAALSSSGLEFKIKNLQLDAGAFFASFLGPIVKNVKKITSPLQPVIDVIRAPIPVISELSQMIGREPVSLFTLMKAVGGNKIQMILSLISLLEFINSIPADNSSLLIPLLDGADQTAFELDPQKVAGERMTGDQADTLIRPETKKEPTSLLGKIFANASDPEGAFGVKGLSFPFLQKPSQLFGLLMGKDITLVRYEPGELRASAGLSWTFPPIMIGPIPVQISVGVSASVAGRFAVGYDTSGLRAVFSGGSADKLINGIFIDDYDANGVDVPEITLTGRVTVSAAVSLVVVAVGVDGGVELNIYLNLNDDPNPDGKLRIREIVNKLANPTCLFDISGSIDAFLGAFIRVGIKPFSKTFRIELIRIRILDFTINLCKEEEPVLAHLESGKLKLNMGPHAGDRNISEDEENEEFIVRQLNHEGTRLSVAAFGVYQEFDVPAKKVLADAGGGDDRVSLEPGVDLAGKPITFTVSSELRGGDGNDRFDGGDGFDQIWGDAGNDTVTGGAGDDQIWGGDGLDVLNGEIGTDTLSGEAGNDVLTGGPGADRLDGGADDDSLNGGPGSQNAANPDLGDVLIGGAGADILEGNAGADYLYGDAELDCRAEGQIADGDDQIKGGEGDDLIRGGRGNDRLVGQEGDDLVCGNEGDDLIDGDDDPSDQGAQLVSSGGSGGGNDELSGGSGLDTLRGQGGDDTLEGDAGNDTLIGAAGNDTLRGGSENDAITGDAGSDTIFGDAGDDTITGGRENDSIQGNEGADTIAGDEGADVISGGAHDDSIRGGQGDDTIDGDAGSDTIYGDSGLDLLRGGDDEDLIFGGIDADTIEGNAGADTINGDGGNDGIRGGSGPDLIHGDGGDDVIHGDEDNDTINGDAGLDTIYGNAGDDTIFGDADADRIEGNEDADLIYGNAGDDTIFGNAGDDRIHGDDGDDDIEGNQGSDVISGDAGDDDIIGGSALAGIPDAGDSITGDDGYDLIAGDNALITRTGATNSFDGSPGRSITLFDLDSLDPALSGGDTIMGNAANDHIYGGGAQDVIHGNAGDDKLEGNGGGDYVYGDAGQDDLIGGSSQDQGGHPDGADQLWGGDAAAELPGDYDVIAGDNAAIVRPLGPTGQWQVNSFNAAVVRRITLFDVAAVAGPALDPTLSGGDTIDGEANDDVIYGQGGGDTIHGGSGDDDIEGNAGDDTIFGETGDDDILGGTGRINLDGPAGVDGRLDGADTISGGAGYDVIAGDNALIARVLVDGQWQQNSFNAGLRHHPRILLDIDSPSAVLVSGGDTIHGDGEDDLIYGQGGDDTIHGDGGDDVVEGNAADDTISGDAGQDDLIGGTIQPGVGDGADTISGGDDHDVVIGDNGTIVRLLDGGGHWVPQPDTQALIRLVMLYDVELVDGPSQTGRSGDDTITGDAGHDRIFGQGGDDRIHGNGGPDYVEGNAGDDLIYGDGGEDDLIGGGSVVDGVIGGAARGDGLIDGADRIYGDDGDDNPATGGDDGDVIAGDNALVVRLLGSGGFWRVDPNSGDALRAVTLYDVERVTGQPTSQLASGSDVILAEGGRDLVFGQGNDEGDDDGDQRANEDPADGLDNDRDGREGQGSSSYDCLDGADNDADGLADGDDASCVASIDEDGEGDELRGGAGVDYIEGNHGADLIYGDAGEDDLIGGSSAGDGVIGGGVAPTNLRDGDDVIAAGDEDDVVLGDNGTILRPLDGAGLWQRIKGAGFDIPIRLTSMHQLPEQSGAYGNDFIRGGAGEDDLYGQLGDDYVEGNAGEDALVGDLGLITNRLEDGSRQRIIKTKQPFLTETIFPAGMLSRLVQLYSASTAQGVGGDDTLLGGDGADSIHGGHGDDLINGDTGDDIAVTADDDRLFGGDGADVAWGGRGHDHLWGGYGDDELDVRPRLGVDPPSWFTYGRVDYYQGFDTIYGGWDHDAMQGDVGGPGTQAGDRLMDWEGAYNAYYVCPGAYGEGMINRSISPDLIGVLQTVSEADGAHLTATAGSSGFRELGMVFNNEVRLNTHPVHPDHPAHFVCN